MKMIKLHVFRLFIILIGIVLLNPVEAKSEREITVTKVSGGDYKLGFGGEPFGNEDTVWDLSFQFSEYGVVGRFLVASKEDIPVRESNEIVITFNTLPPVETLTIYCDRYDGFGFNFLLSSGIIKPVKFDYWTTPLNYIEANNMAAFIAFRISSIKINGMLLPGPYPTTQEFLKLFDIGVGKFPGCSYYDKYRSDRYGDSRKNSQKKGGNSTSQNQNSKLSNSKPSNQIPSDPKLSRPADIPAGIQIVTGKELGERCIYKDYNCTLFKKSSKSIPDFGSPTFAELLAHPLGIKDLTWTANEALLFRETDKTGYPIKGYYHYTDKYGYLRTEIEIPGIMFLPGEFIFNGSRIRFRANTYSPSVNISIHNGSTYVQSYITYHVYYDKSPLKEFYSKKDQKKFNKEVLKFYYSLIEDLKKQGYEFKKEKPMGSGAYRCSLTLDDGKRCTLSLQLWPWSDLASEYISLSILDTKPSCSF